MPTVINVEEQFLALVCSDEDLLRAEFEAIIGAEWADRPPNAPVPEAAGRRPAPGARRHEPAQQLLNSPHRPGVGGWARQRSPPDRRQ